jgi:thiamine-monophosphate kinase
MRVPLGAGKEFDLIRDLLGPQGELPPGVLVGPGDDCAVLEGGLVASTDLAVEGVHFRRDWIGLGEAGFRATAAALSDLAAMAAEPRGVLLSMAIPSSQASVDAPQLQVGVAEACGLEGVQVIGGDLSGSPGPVVLNVTVLGQTDSPVLRSGTEVGDELWVTGVLGGSAAAVASWSQGRTPGSSLREAFVRPSPRIREALWLSGRVPLRALIDLSDGLAGDAGHLAAASGLGFVLNEASIPIHPELVQGGEIQGEPLHFALAGGEDYELCFTVPSGALDKWVGPFQDHFAVPLTRVGVAREGEGVFLEEVGGTLRPLLSGGFSHFAGEEGE